jgi:hypothetical protein
LGRASRLKNNRDRERRQRERDDAKDYDGRVLAGLKDKVHVTAMHEAGHVIAAFALGLDVKFATVQVRAVDHKTAGVDGCTALAEELRPLASFTADACRRHAMQLLAAQVAESTVNDSDEDMKHGVGGDAEQLMQFTMQALGLTPAEMMNLTAANEQLVTDWIDERVAETEELLTPLRASIVRVANHLVQHLNEEIPGNILRGIYGALSPDDAIAG